VALLLLQDEQMIEAFTPHASQKALTDGIRSRSVIWYCENLDVTHFRNPCEAHPKLAIMITDEVLRPLCWLLVASVRQMRPLRTPHHVACSLPIPQKQSRIETHVPAYLQKGIVHCA
jgi:hypothetical protein